MGPAVFACRSPLAKEIEESNSRVQCGRVSVELRRTNAELVALTDHERARFEPGIAEPTLDAVENAVGPGAASPDHPGTRGTQRGQEPHRGVAFEDFEPSLADLSDGRSRGIGVAVVKLDQSTNEIVTSAMSAGNSQEIAPLSGTHADRPNRTGRTFVERIRDQVLDDEQSQMQRGPGAVVVGMPCHVVPHQSSALRGVLLRPSVGRPVVVGGIRLTDCGFHPQQLALPVVQTCPHVI